MAPSSSSTTTADAAAGTGQHQVLRLNERSLNVVKSKLLTHPPRGPFAQFPLKAQLDLVPFELTLQLRLEGLWAADESLAFPTVACLLEDILLFSSNCFAVSRRALDSLAWTLVEKANREYLLTDDEVMHMKQQQQHEHHKGSSSSSSSSQRNCRIKYALRYFPDVHSQWLDMMGSVDMMQYPSELSRWIQMSVTNAFTTAARRNELIGQHKSMTLQLELCAPSERPFHLHLYLSSQDNAGDWDWKAWHHYVVLINARARRQAAKNAFYTILQLIRDHQNVPQRPPRHVLAESTSSTISTTSNSSSRSSNSSSNSCHPPPDKIALLLDNNNNTTININTNHNNNEHRKAAPSSKIHALRAKQDAAVLEVLSQFSQCCRVVT